MTQKAEFETLVEVHSRELYVYLWRLLGDEAEAQDALQETFLRALKAYGRLDEAANTRAWLYKIAGNWARTLLKKRSRRDGYSQQFVDGLAADGRGVPEQVEHKQRLVTLHAAVMALPQRQREAILLRKYQELGYAEIAEALNCSQDSARASVYQGLKKLRRKLGEEVST